MAKHDGASLHWSLTGISERLDASSPPEGDFDPQGTWAHRYAIWISTQGSRTKSSKQGHVKIYRSPIGRENMIELRIEQSVPLAGWRFQSTKARVRCRVNRLATPVSWNIESVGLDARNKTSKLPKFEESAVAADGRITRSGKRHRRMKISNTFTQDWALFDAVQRLKGEKETAIEFDMLEDFDLLRPRQRLSYHDTIEVKLGGKMTRLIGYHQIGQGILPIHYWLNEQHRLLFVTGGCRIYVFDSEIK